MSFLEEPADLAGMLGGLVHQVLGPHSVDGRIRTVVLTDVILIEPPNQTRTDLLQRLLQRIPERMTIAQDGVDQRFRDRYSPTGLVVDRSDCLVRLPGSTGQRLAADAAICLTHSHHSVLAR